MRISFVIPAYNEEHLITSCINAVKRELARGDYDAEIIVVDNASTDRTNAIARAQAGVYVVEEPRKGLTFARQAGYAASTGDLIANIDADTLLPQGWIETVLDIFENHNRVVALSGPYIYYDLSPTERFFVSVYYRFAYLLHWFNQNVLHVGAMLQGGNFILRRSAFEKIGGFDTSISFYGEDTDIARRMSKIGRVVWTFDLPMFTSGRRLRKEGVITTAWHYAVNFFSVTLAHKPITDEYTSIRE